MTADTTTAAERTASGASDAEPARTLVFTAAQAARFWNLNADDSRRALDMLAGARVLRRTADDRYVLESHRQKV